MTRAIICFVLLTTLTNVTGECGKRDVLVAGKIVGGRKAVKNEFPWDVALGYAEDNVFIHFCGGSIINKRWIITAAHCLRGRRISEIRAVIGETNIEAIREATFVTNIVRIVTHEQYKSPSFANDIALLFTERPIPINGRNINKICLPNRNELYSGKVYASGWGRIDEGENTSDDLNVVEIEIYEDSVCEFLYNINEISFHRSLMFCAGKRSHKSDTCNGDSGGPVEKTVGEAVFLVGIVSFGEGCGREFSPGVYTEVSYYIDWIEAVMKSESSTIDDIQDFKTCGMPGRKKYSVQGRVKTWTESIPFPWNIAIQMMQLRGLQYKFVCAGVIVNEYWILTAAGCVQRSRIILMRAAFGVTRISETGVTGVVGLRSAHIHPDFNNDTNENDIALLRTLGAMRLNIKPNLGPVVNALCLPRNDSTVFTGIVVASGWSPFYSQNDLQEKSMKTFFMRILRDKDCIDYFSNASRTYQSSEMLCGRTTSKIEACEGFKGSAVQRTVNRQKYLAAIVAVCDASMNDTSGVYTEVAHYIPWIIDTISFEERKRRNHIRKPAISEKYRHFVKTFFSRNTNKA